MPELINTNPLVIAQYLKKGGADTVIGFKEPVRVSYKTANLLPFDDTPGVMPEKTGRKRETGGFQLSYEYKVSMDASMLVARTLHMAGAKYVSWVIRAEEFDGSYLSSKTELGIEEFPYRESPEIEEALKNHCTLVRSLLSLDYNHPQVLYEGPMLFPRVAKL